MNVDYPLATQGPAWQAGPTFRGTVLALTLVPRLQTYNLADGTGRKLGRSAKTDRKGPNFLREMDFVCLDMNWEVEFSAFFGMG